MTSAGAHPRARSGHPHDDAPDDDAPDHCAAFHRTAAPTEGTSSRPGTSSRLISAARARADGQTGARAA
ncbi:hypothetical protein JBE04_28795 [Streptomyces sp. PRKS01-29]|nr:hypothetical protein [Streptomyces sabulosicollis]MBI0298355.1 hypothetical protein [Streptomyces sabulosicollis]